MGIWETLALDMDRHRVVALVGAGGKSSTLYALARQARDAGRTVIITTTTHILPHPGLLCTDEADPNRLRALLERRGVITVGRIGKEGKLTGTGALAPCLAAADVVVVEADGARTRPLKVPAAHEPVIPPEARAVVAVAGMDSVGESIGEVCHRPELVCALLHRKLTDLITPWDVAEILASPQGGRKGVAEEMAFRCLLNKTEEPQRADYARQIRALLAQQGIQSAITYYTEEERGGRCLF